MHLNSTQLHSATGGNEGTVPPATVREGRERCASWPPVRDPATVCDGKNEGEFRIPWANAPTN